MNLPKTICIDNREIHIDPVGDQIELSVKLRTQFGLHSLAWVRLSKEKCMALQEALYLAGAKEAI